MRVIGGVANITNEPIYQVNVQVSAYDVSNQLIGTFSGSTIFTATLPGQLNPFDLYTDIPAEDTHFLSAQVTSWAITNTQIYIVPTIVITNIVQVFEGVSVT